jgi:hypothetical protein
MHSGSLISLFDNLTPRCPQAIAGFFFLAAPSDQIAGIGGTADRLPHFTTKCSSRRSQRDGPRWQRKPEPSRCARVTQPPKRQCWRSLPAMTGSPKSPRSWRGDAPAEARRQNDIRHIAPGHQDDLTAYFQPVWFAATTTVALRRRRVIHDQRQGRHLVGAGVGHASQERDIPLVQDAAVADQAGDRMIHNIGSSSATSPLILTVARRLGMGVVSVARQLGAIGNLSQLVGSLPCAGGIFPQVLPVLHQDTGHLVKFLGRRHDRIILRVAQADWAGF